jgi:hypothetical protein
MNESFSKFPNVCSKFVAVAISIQFRKSLFFFLFGFCVLYLR